VDPPTGGVSCGDIRDGGIRLSRIPEGEADRPGRRPHRWQSQFAWFATVHVVTGSHAGAHRAAARTRASRAVPWACMRRRSVRAVRDNRARHSTPKSAGIAVKYGGAPTGFFFFVLDGCATAVDASIGADEVVARYRGISLFCTIAFTTGGPHLDRERVEALSRTFGSLIHDAADRAMSSTGIPVWRARSRWARSTVSAVGVASISARRVCRRVRVREMASCRPRACCRRMMSR
jgi:hypothetical protein